QVVVLSPNNVTGEQWETLKREWLAHPQITAVTRSDILPFQPNGRTAEVTNESGDAARIAFMGVDYDFFETYEIGLLAGRAFSVERNDRPLPDPSWSPRVDARFIV